MQLDIVVSPPANPHRRATRVFGVAYESHPVGGFDAKSLLSSLPGFGPVTNGKKEM